MTIRQPEATSLARATAFNKHNICTFFNIVKETITKLNVSGAQIYNLDESGLTTVQKLPKLIAPRGVKQIDQVTPRERGELVTICCIVSALGHIILPVFLEFLRKSEKVAGKFVKPKVEDVASVPITCIKAQLTRSTITGTTSWTKDGYVFKESLEDINVR